MDINNINNRLRTTWGQTQAESLKPTVNMNDLIKLANRSDKVLFESVEASVKNMQDFPTLENINRQITKITNLQSESILPETDTYLKARLLDSQIFKDFVVQKENILNTEILPGIKNLNAKNRDDVKTVQDWHAKLNKNEAASIFTTKEATSLKDSYDNKRKMLDEGEDYNNLMIAMNAVSDAKTTHDEQRIVSEYVGASKRPVTIQVLINHLKDKRASTGSNIGDDSESSLQNSQIKLYNSTRPKIHELISYQNKYFNNSETDKTIDLPIQYLATQIMPPATTYGSASGDKIGQYDWTGLLSKHVQGIVKLAGTSEFSDDSVTGYMKNNKKALLNINDKDNRLHVKKLISLMMSMDKFNNMTEDNPNHHIKHVVELRSGILNSIYDQVPLLYPDTFLGKDGKPIFGLGSVPDSITSPTSNKPPNTVNIFSPKTFETTVTNAESTGVTALSSDLDGDESETLDGWTRKNEKVIEFLTKNRATGNDSSRNENSGRPRNQNILPALNKEDSPEVYPNVFELSDFLKLDAGTPGNLPKPSRPDIPVPIDEEGMLGDQEVNLDNIDFDEFKEWKAPAPTVQSFEKLDIRGVDGKLVTFNQHAYDFRQTVLAMSNRAVKLQEERYKSGLTALQRKQFEIEQRQLVGDLLKIQSSVSSLGSTFETTLWDHRTRSNQTKSSEKYKSAIDEAVNMISIIKRYINQ